jgi:hypothetical protein
MIICIVGVLLYNGELSSILYVIGSDLRPLVNPFDQCHAVSLFTTEP